MIETLDTDLMALMFRKIAVKLYMGLTANESDDLMHSLSTLSTLITGLAPVEDNPMLAELLESQAIRAVNERMDELVKMLIKDN
jgi:hypothetical protein